MLGYNQNIYMDTRMSTIDESVYNIRNDDIATKTPTRLKDSLKVCSMNYDRMQKNVGKTNEQPSRGQTGRQRQTVQTNRGEVRA